MMEISRIDNDKYQVIYNGKTKIMSLDEMIFLLSQPESEHEQTMQERMEEFWESEPGYITR